VTPADVLRPNLIDVRLWRAWTAEPIELNKRVAVLDPRDVGDYRPPTVRRDPLSFESWTAADSTGTSWGVSPGVVHVAGRSVPLCGGSFDSSDCGFGVTPFQRDAQRAALRTAHEIRSQLLFGQIQERAHAVRERRDAERAAERAP
jgi:hypothetical protein